MPGRIAHDASSPRTIRYTTARSDSLLPLRWMDDVLRPEQARTDTLSVSSALPLDSYIDLEISSALGPADVYCTHTDGTVYWYSSTQEMKYSQGKYTVRALVKPGLYEICATVGFVETGQTWMLRDSVLVNPAARVDMTDAEAIYTVGTVPKNEFGQALDSALVVDWNQRMYSRRTGCSYGLSSWSNYYGKIQFLNHLPKGSSNWIFEYCSRTDPNLPKVYSFAGRVAGPFEADHVAEVKAGDLVRRTITYLLHQAGEHLASVDYFSFSNWVIGWGWYAPQTQTSLAAPYVQDWFASGEPVENFPFNQWYFNFCKVHSYSGTPPFAPNADSFRFLTPNQHPGVDGVLRSSLKYTKGPALESRGTQIIYGLGPRFYYGRTTNSTGMLKAKTNTWLGMAEQEEDFSEPHVPLFLNQAMDYTPSTLLYHLRDSQGQILASGNSAESFWQEQTPDGMYFDNAMVVGLPVAGRYTFEIIDTTSWVLNHRGLARVLLTQDTRLQDKNPPSMASFEILADSERTDQILPGKQALIQTVVTDQEGPLQDIQLYYRREAESLWLPLPLTPMGEGRYRNTDLAQLPEAYISLRLVATDAAGNTLDYRAEPAFYNGTYQNHPPVPGAELHPGPLDTVQLYTMPKAIRFHWKQALDPDLDTLRSQIHLWGIGVDTTLTALSDTVALATLPALVPGASYAWTVTSSDGQLAAISDTAHFSTASTLLAVKEAASELPTLFALKQNSPNPFNPTTTISYELPRACTVSLTVYDVVGREVEKLVRDELQPAGRYKIVFNGERLASGLYFYRLVAGGFVKTKKLLLVR